MKIRKLKITYQPERWIVSAVQDGALNTPVVFGEFDALQDALKKLDEVLKKTEVVHTNCCDRHDFEPRNPLI